MGFAVVLIVLVSVVAAVVVTRPKAVTFKLTDMVGDVVGHMDIVEIGFMKKKDNLILNMKVSDKIPLSIVIDEPEYHFYFLFDVDKDNLEDFTVTINIDWSGSSVSLGDKKLSYEHLGSAITIPLAEIGDLRSFDLRAYSSYGPGTWVWGEHVDDTVPDVGWAEVPLT